MKLRFVDVTKLRNEELRSLYKSLAGEDAAGTWAKPELVKRVRAACVEYVKFNFNQ